ncbi:MAG: SPOR domain-containing protein [Lachnospiraceae bacterium]|nr:SPOR domain-containing protein [Lachnospiraceae bacterium]
MKIKLAAVNVIMCVVFLFGCGAASDKAEPPEKMPETVNTGEKDVREEESLAKRLCGKYSCHVDGEDVDENEVCIMNVITFGDNLYAFCGEAMEDDSDSLESYSFWAAEFIPDDAEVLKSTESDKAEVTELNFSIMSNLGKYWGPGDKGTITLTDEGLVLEGFSSQGYFPAGTFLKDDRVEDVFPYLNKESREEDSMLQGVWVLEDETAPVYLRVDGSNFQVYKKSPEKEVYFAAGGCDIDGGEFSGTANVFGCGGIPDEWSGNYKVDGDKLYLTIEGETLPEELSGAVTLNRLKEEDIHVFTMDEVKFNEDSFGFYGAESDLFEHQYEDGFYGIWTSACKDREAAEEEAKKLEEMGYDSYVCYSPEWENMNSDEYYCVTAGRYLSEAEAEDEIQAVKSAGFKDAYIKNSGKRKDTKTGDSDFGDE